MKTTLTALIAASLASTVAIAPAHADPIRVEVNHADLDIKSAAGAAAFAGRIESNVALACTRTGDIRDLKSVSLCKTALMSDAVTQLTGIGATEAAQALAAKG